MNKLLRAAAEAHQVLNEIGLSHAFIGGLANLRWGRPRVTEDADITSLTYFEHESEIIDAIFAKLPPRIANAREVCLRNRVVLCQSSEQIGIDISLGGFPFEERLIERATPYDFGAGVQLPVICAEDLVVMKVFAGRDQDWFDVRGILARQRSDLNLQHVRQELPELLEAIDATDRLQLFEKLVSESPK